MKFLLNVHDKIINYCHDKSMCILCVFWIVPFFAGLTVHSVILIMSLFILTLFIPVFLSIFILLLLMLALINVILFMPILSILFVAILWFLRNDIKNLVCQLFSKQNYSFKKPVISQSVSFIIILFILHGIICMIPISKIIKFAILSVLSLVMFRKSNHKSCKL